MTPSTVAIIVRCPADLKRALQTAAGAAGQSMTAYVLTAIRAAITQDGPGIATLARQIVRDGKEATSHAVQPQHAADAPPSPSVGQDPASLEP